MSQAPPTKLPARLLFRGPYVLSGIAFALVGYLLEELDGGSHAFENLMLFGGLFLGVGVERNRQAAQSSSPPSAPGDGSSQFGSTQR